MIQKVLIGIIILTMIVLMIFFNYRHKAERWHRNVENSEKVKLGMFSNEVIEIMGNPDEIYPMYGDENINIYFYQPPFGASDGIEFYFDTTSQVVKIIPYEPT